MRIERNNHPAEGGSNASAQVGGFPRPDARLNLRLKEARKSQNCSKKLINLE